MIRPDDEAVKARCIAAIRGLPRTRAWEVSVTAYSPRRGLKPNRRYWAILRQIADHTGDEPDALHRVFKDRYCPPKIINVLKQEIEVRSTSILTQQEFADYVTRVEAFAATELGMTLQ